MKQKKRYLPLLMVVEQAFRRWKGGEFIALTLNLSMKHAAITKLHEAHSKSIKGSLLALQWGLIDNKIGHFW